MIYYFSYAIFLRLHFLFPYDIHIIMRATYAFSAAMRAAIRYMILYYFRWVIFFHDIIFLPCHAITYAFRCLILFLPLSPATIIIFIIDIFTSSLLFSFFSYMSMILLCCCHDILFCFSMPRYYEHAAPFLFYTMFIIIRAIAFFARAADAPPFYIIFHFSL